METALTIRYAISLLYLVAAMLYVSLLRREALTRPGAGGSTLKSPMRVFQLALVLHAVEIVLRGAESGSVGAAPFSGVSGFLSIFSFLFGVSYWLLQWRYRKFKIASLGAFYLPVLFVLHAGASFLKSPLATVPELNTGVLFVVHVVPTLFSYAALTAGCVAGVAYLLLERQLRRRHYGVLMRGLPNLDLVERVNTSSVKIGLPLLIIGTVVGLAMARDTLGAEFQWDAKVWITILVILIFSFQLVSRRFSGWPGRRAIIISVLGFAIILFSATVVNLFFSALHGFN